MNNTEPTCPRCGGTSFTEIDCGPDSYDDDIFYISEICVDCELYHSGWTDKWLLDCAHWQEEEEAGEYLPSKTNTETET